MHRRALTYCLLAFYLFAATGLEVRAHYCGEELESITFFGDPEKNCCGDAEAAMGCCHDEVVKADLSDDQRPAPTYLPAPAESSFSLAPYPPVFNLRIPPFIHDDRLPAGSHGPPRNPATPIYLMDRVLRL
jgi:hypothetical protein